ncbi:MlaD family protein [Plebeiibacterium marinum]|uniref:MlaD family protein n=1 Tax=Plebeiibacterium marinum TaxID=2992111 RepID=A0AAE3MHC8_9BACT|nr:MlaD family protein [Plebeiobacterium marinum]MCW3807687.1 MlaD family protein [Plebeiobacterium marinum]
MIKVSKEVKVGFTILLALFLLVWGINFLKGKDIFMPGYKLYGVYSRIDGLTEGSPIYFKGFQIGSVRTISFIEGSSDEVVVVMAIEKDIDFPDNTVAQIYSLDLMGSKGIRFLYGDTKRALVASDTMKTSIMGGLADQVSQEVLPLKDKAENLVVKFDSVLTNLNDMFDKDNKDGIASGVNDFAGMMKNLNDMSLALKKNLQADGAVGEMLSNLDSVSVDLKNNARNLSLIMANVETLSGKLANSEVDQLIGEMNSAMLSFNGVLKAVNDQEGSLGLLLNNKELYNNLNEASVNLDRLLADVRHNPGRYVHFSAVNFGGGKAKVIDDSGAIVYKVLLKKTKEPLDLRGKELLDGECIGEDRDGKYFVYTLGEDSDFSKIQVLKNKVIDQYPEARVIAFEGGKVKVVKDVM